MHRRPIILIEDDHDDCEMVTTSFKELGIKNELLCFHNPLKAIEYLSATSQFPLLFISDINLPLMNGFELKAKLNSENSLYSFSKVPFVYLSTASGYDFVSKAESLETQGYFRKPTSFTELKDTLSTIIDYWYRSLSTRTYNV